MLDRKQTSHICLMRGSERYVFRWMPGHEAEVIDHLSSLAADCSSNFDWFDAAVLSLVVARRRRKEMEQPISE